jgi:hypothetical protein
MSKLTLLETDWMQFEHIEMARSVSVVSDLEVNKLSGGVGQEPYLRPGKFSARFVAIPESGKLSRHPAFTLSNTRHTQAIELAPAHRVILFHT